MTIFIPTPLRPYAGGQPQVEIQASTIAEALSALIDRGGLLFSEAFEMKRRYCCGHRSPFCTWEV